MQKLDLSKHANKLDEVKEARERAKQEARSSWREIIVNYTRPAQKRVGGQATYICPFCGHGKNGDGLTGNPKSKDGNGIKCFACDFSGDIIDFIMQYKGVDYNAALEEAAATLGINITAQGGHTDAQGDSKRTGDKTTAAAAAAVKAPENAGETPPDYSEYYYQCQQNLNDSPEALSYLSARGISLQAARSRAIGFDPAADPANAPGAMGDECKPHPTPRIIVPVTKSFYIGRRIDGVKDYAKMNSAGGGTGVFAYKLLEKSPEPVFVTEGAFDALSVIECGHFAVALNSTTNAQRLIDMLHAIEEPPKMILCLDNDDAGQRATETIRTGLQRLGIPYIVANIAGDYKDPNDALINDPEAFEMAIDEALTAAAAAQPVPDETSAAAYLSGGIFEQDIDYFRQYKGRKTGIHPGIDKHLTLYPGLAALGGASSLGKTTFAVNLIDKLLARGETVLYFSLEQLPIEIITKSLARIIRERDPFTKLTNTDIKNGGTSEQLEAIKREYIQQARNYFIFTGDFRMTAADITNRVEQFRRDHGGDSCKPIVVIDYLQLIAPPDGFKGGIREYTDENIKTLKDMQKRNGLFVLMISNFNRSSNYEPVSYESFKETSMIEYTCDYIFGLQLALLDAENDDFYTTTGSKGGRSDRPIDQKRKLVNEAQSAIPKKVEFVSLKNRNGKQFFKAYFDYYPANDLFTPADDDGFAKNYAGNPFQGNGDEITASF